MNEEVKEKHLVSPRIKDIIIAAVITLFASIIAPIIIDYIKGKTFNMPTINEMLAMISNIYYYARTPLRIAYYAWFTVFILYSYAERVDNHHYHFKREIKATNFKSWSLPFLAIVAVLNHFFVIKPAINRFPIYMENYAIICDLAGYLSLAIGFYLIFSARAVLNGYWGPHLYVYKNAEHNKLVDHGIYSKIRHPIYVGQILMSGATFLLSNSWLVIIFPIYVVYSNYKRAENEERHLSEIFGEKHSEYVKNVPKWHFRLFS